MMNLWLLSYLSSTKLKVATLPLGESLTSIIKEGWSVFRALLAQRFLCAQYEGR